MHRYFFLTFMTVLLTGCGESEDYYRFKSVPSSATGLDFQNTISENDSINVIDFQYCYNGGGVGIGDFNNDGLEDIFFTGNQVSSRLYLNLGELNFKDVTTSAGVNTSDWITGVVVVDINNDGWDDIYLSVGGSNCETGCENLLFVNKAANNETPEFVESADKYGLNIGGYSQQALFFDADRDGDLDVYIARNGNVNFDKNLPFPKDLFPNHLEDVMLENTQPDGMNHPYFVNISNKAGIVEPGFSLGIGLSDLNQDNWPDIYIGNDFISDDLLYLNQGGDSIGFSEQSAAYFKHHTYNAMGLDFADINSDGIQDLLVLDMLPDLHERRKQTSGATNYDKYLLSLHKDYKPQFVKNTLQVSSRSIGDRPVPFQELAYASAISATDWSWSPLFADFDSDGDEDLLITNGYGKDITDLDFINFSVQNNVYGTEEVRDKRIKELLRQRPRILMSNFLYNNTGDNSFEDVSQSWIENILSISNGAAIADFDLDGDVDIVVNNIDQKAFFYENLTNTLGGHRYLQIRLSGPVENRKGIGATVRIWQKGREQMHYQSVVRGYLSSVSPIIHFGLTDSPIDSLHVLWPDGNTSFLSDISPNQNLTVSWEKSKPGVMTKQSESSLPFQEEDSLLNFYHRENLSNDYVYQHLMPTQHSGEGPVIAASGNGKYQFIGGSHGQPSQIYIQKANKKFVLSQELEASFEDSAALFFDFDQDGDQDLFVGSGGSEYPESDTIYRDRLYENIDNRFERRVDIIQDIRQSTSSVIAADYDRDGDLDLFITSAIRPRNFPLSPKQILLENTKGTFKVAAEFDDLGMVSQALWTDLDGDGWEDLILAGNWAPISVLKNENGVLRFYLPEISDLDNKILRTDGWWQSIAAGDFDKDGDVDFVLGNRGQNTFIEPSQEFPHYIYRKDFDANGSVDPIIGAYQQTESGTKLMPLQSRDDIMKQLVGLKSLYPSYSGFATVEFKELLGIENLEEATLVAHQSKSVLLINNGDFKFQMTALPAPCQVAPIKAILVLDFNLDGNLDIILGGNDYQAEPQFGRYDALNGLVLSGLSNGEFEVLTPDLSGFLVTGQVSDIIEFPSISDYPIIWAGQNNGALKIYTLNQ